MNNVLHYRTFATSGGRTFNICIHYNKYIFFAGEKIERGEFGEIWAISGLPQMGNEKSAIFSKVWVEECRLGRK
jgi:hypothetical protein